MTRGLPWAGALAVVLALGAASPAGAATGDVTSIAGTTVGFAGDGGPATDAQLNFPTGVSIAPDGTIYFSDEGNARLRQISPSGIITTVAGNGTYGDSGDGGPATVAEMDGPLSVAIDAVHDVLYVADFANNRVRAVDLATGTMEPYAGCGYGCFGYGGDGGPALDASLEFPESVAVGPGGDLYIGDDFNCVVRKVDYASGIITTVAGQAPCTGAAEGTGDGGPATSATLTNPWWVDVDAAGDLFVLDLGGQPGAPQVVREVDATTGIINTVAGGGDTKPGSGLATDMDISPAQSITHDAVGDLYIGTESQVFRVALASDQLTVVAGTRTQGFSGDGGPATDATFDDILGLAVNSAGDFVLADSNNARIRSIESLVPPEAQPSVSIGDVTVAKPSSGTAPASFPVSLSAASDQTVTVDFATADGTAKAPDDYAATSGTVTFAPGVTSQTVTVQVVGNSNPGPDLTFFVNLSNASNATIADGQGVGTISGLGCTDGPVTIRWDGGAGTDAWTDAANWDDAATHQDRVPSSTDNVCIGVGGASVDLVDSSDIAVQSLQVQSGASLSVESSVLDVTSTTTDSTVSSLSLSSPTVPPGTIGGAGNLTVTGSMTCDACTLNGTGTVTIAPGASIGLSGLLPSMDGSHLVVDGGATATVSGASTFLSMSNGARIDNAGTFVMSDGATVGLFSNPAVFANTGTVDVTSGADTIGAAFDNDGTTTIQSGSLLLDGGDGALSPSGAFQVSAGAALKFGGGFYVLSSTASVTGDGTMTVLSSSPGVTLSAGVTFGLPTIDVSGGLLTANASLTLATVSVTDLGELSGSGGVTVTGSFTCKSCTLHAGVTLASGGSGTLGGVTMTNGTLVIASGATATWSSGDIHLIGSNIQNAGSLVISGSGTIDDSGTERVTNTGTITKTSIEATTIKASLDNQGTTTIQAGTLALSNSVGSAGGAFQVSAGALLQFGTGVGTYQFGPTASVTGDGAMTVATQAKVVIPAGFTYGLPSAVTVASGGTLELDGDMTLPGVSASGTIKNFGNLTVTGPFTCTGCSMSGSGTTTIQSGGSLSLDSSTHSITVGNHLVIPSGVGTTWSGDGHLVLSSHARLDNAGTFTISGNGTIDKNSLAVFSNTGTLAKTSSGTTTIGSVFDSDGTTNLQAGTLVLTGGDGGLSSSGGFSVSAGASLQFSSLYTFPSSASITGAGTMSVGSGGTVTLPSGSTYGLPSFNLTSGGVLTLNADVSVSTVTATAGTIGGSGHLTVGHLFTCLGCTQNGSGTTTIASGGSINLTTSSATVTLDNGRHLAISGGSTPATATWSGNGHLSMLSTSEIDNAGTFTISGSGTVDPNASAVFSNTGTLTKTATGVTTIGTTFTNSGTLTVGAGRLDLTGALTNYNAATKTLSGGTFDVVGTLRFAGADIATNQAAVVMDGSSSLVRDTSNNDAFRDLTNNASSGSLTIKNGRTLTLPKALFNVGTLEVDSGSTLTPPSLTLTGGTLLGSGTVASSVTNTAGVVSPGATIGTLTITGSYTQSPIAALSIDVAGTTPGTGFDVLAVSGSATLDGTLTDVTAQGFTPTSGQTFAFLSAGSRTGTFATVAGNELGGGANYGTVYKATGATLSVQAGRGPNNSNAAMSLTATWIEHGGVSLASGAVKVTNGSTVTSFTTDVMHNPADGNSCSTDTERQAGCEIEVGASTTLAGTVLTTGESIPGWVPAVGGTCAPDGTVTIKKNQLQACSITNVHPDTGSSDPTGVLTIDAAWQDRTGAPLAPTTITVKDSSSATVASFSTDLMFSKTDGSPCTTEAAREAGCAIEVGVVAASGGSAFTVSASSGDYVPTLSGDCGPDGSITVKAHLLRTCTVTGTRPELGRASPRPC